MRGHVYDSRIIALPQRHPVLEHRNPYRVGAIIDIDAQVAPAEHYGTRTPCKDIKRAGNTRGRASDAAGSLCLAHGSDVEHNTKKQEEHKPARIPPCGTSVPRRFAQGNLPRLIHSEKYSFHSTEFDG